MNTWQSDEYVRMSFGNLTNKVLALGPLVLVGVICGFSRFHVDPFDPVYQSAEQQDAINAYIGPVKATLEKRLSTSDPARIRRVAQIWIDGAASGKLKPMLPCASDDTIRGPIKSQIYLANQRVADDLMRLTVIDMSKGDYHTAAQDAVQSLRCCEVLKYSDPIATFVLDDKQEFSLKFLGGLVPRLSDSDKGWLRTQLMTLKNAQQPLDEMYRVVKYNAQREEQRSQTNETASYDPQHADEIGFEIDPTSFDAAMAQLRRGAKRVSSTPYLQETGLAYKSQTRMVDLLNQVIASSKISQPDKAI